MRTRSSEKLAALRSLLQLLQTQLLEVLLEQLLELLLLLLEQLLELLRELDLTPYFS